MGGIDSSDQLAAYYDARTRGQSQWQPRIELRARKTSMINAMILWNSGKPVNEQLTLLQFTKKLIEQWSGYNDDVEVPNHVDDDSDSSEDEEEVEELTPIRRRHLFSWQGDYARRTTGQHFPQLTAGYQTHTGSYADVRICCIICKLNTTSSWQQCGIFLCLKKGAGQDCWAKFHSESDLGASKRKAVEHA